MFRDPLAPLRGKRDIRPHELFCPKFDAEKLLFVAFFFFFGIVRILTTVRYYHRNKWNTDSLFTARAIKNGVCLHLCCSSALAGPAILQLAKFNFDILVLRKVPYCILLLSAMPVDAAQKKMMKFSLLGV